MNARRNNLKRLAVAGLLGGGATLMLREALASEKKPLQTGLHTSKGNVSVDGKPAQTGMAISNSAVIATGAGSQAIFVIGQDAYLLRENSEVRFSAKAASLTADAMRVVTGAVLSVFGPGEKRLLTPTATIGIRGTGCYIEAAEDRVYFCLCYGVADVAPIADPTRLERIVTRHHERPVYLHRSAEVPVLVKASMINHKDIELEMLESLVGRRPPFYPDEYRY